LVSGVRSNQTKVDIRHVEGVKTRILEGQK